jgi:hypothetical protein
MERLIMAESPTAESIAAELTVPERVSRLQRRLR